MLTQLFIQRDRRTDGRIRAWLAGVKAYHDRQRKMIYDVLTWRNCRSPSPTQINSSFPPSVLTCLQIRYVAEKGTSPTGLVDYSLKVTNMNREILTKIREHRICCSSSPRAARVDFWMSIYFIHLLLVYLHETLQ